MPRLRRPLPFASFVFLLVGACTAAGGVPSPRDVLGFSPGERAAEPAEIVRYAEALAASSARVRLSRYGETHEGRPLVLLTISSEANLARLPEVRRSVGRILDPRDPLADGELRSLVDGTPAIAYLAYSIHGDEFSGADASLAVAHELATSESADVRELRDELVVLVDPLQNPDGRQRILAMNAAFSGALQNPDPEAMSHAGQWPWGRGNHYFFDLNRDWFMLVQPESGGKADILRTWRPQLVVDAHEMGSRSTFLFNPPREPYNPLLPASTLGWWMTFAADQARAFDERGWSYYTREWNEEFFPGYGSSLPLYQGAVAILYEQASTDAQPVTKPHGAVFSYAEAVERQRVSSWANLRTLAARRRDVLLSQRAARAEAVERGASGAVRAFYFTPAEHPARARSLAATLARLGIEVETLRSAGRLRRARDFWTDGARDVRLPAGSFRVRLDQPDGLLARVVLQPHVPMPDSFLAQEREHQERQKGGRIYDTTAWSPLVLFGVEAYWSDRVDGLGWTLGPTGAAPRAAAPEATARYGWIWDGTADEALVLAADLAARGVHVRAAVEPFTLSGRSFPRGTFLVRREENGEAVGSLVAERARARGVTVASTDTARVEDGPDLGGGRYHLLVEPRIGLVAGAPTDFTSVGAAWHLLDAELGMRVSLLDASSLRSIDLQRYNVIVLPNAWGGGDAYRRVLGEEGLDALERWVSLGGTLVGVAGGAELLAHADPGLSAVRRRRDLATDLALPRLGLSAAAVRSLERMQAMGLSADGTAVASAGAWSATAWPAELGIPGPGSPVLGPGTWAMLGEAGERARRRGPLRQEEPEDGETTPGDGGAEEAERRARKEDARQRRLLPRGALLRVDLDTEHWLASGVGARVAAMVRQGDALVARDPVRTVGRFAPAETLHLGGLLWPEAAGRLAHTAWLTREGRGRGQVVLFAGDPNFRGYARATQRCFLNAVLLGPGMGASRPVPW